MLTSIAPHALIDVSGGGPYSAQDILQGARAGFHRGAIAGGTAGALVGAVAGGWVGAIPAGLIGAGTGALVGGAVGGGSMLLSNVIADRRR